MRHKQGTIAGLSDGCKAHTQAKKRQKLQELDYAQIRRNLLRFAAVRRRPSVRALPLAALALLGLALPVSGAADTPTQLRQQADDLRSENSALSATAHSATLELYALDSRVGAARARVEAMRARVLEVRREQASARHQLAVTRGALTITQRRLRERMIAIYETQEPSTLAVFLGAASLDDALSNVDHYNRFAGQDSAIIRQAIRARASLGKLTRSLADKATRLEGLEADAEAAEASLEAARQEKLAYISQLDSQQQTNESRISSLENEAADAEAQAKRVQAQQAVTPSIAPAQPAAPSVDASGGQSLTVVATAYALPGTTATGVPVGPGVVAVDPSVIPLGTRMTIPGYGEGIAADTGSAIVGNRIDVWLPSEAQAQAWGVKSLTIFLH